MSGDVAQPTIFLSYAHGDHAQAQRLAAALQRGGYTVWWDALIEGGTRYAASIDEALEAADAVVVLWSRNSVNSDWVRDEAAQGRERHRLVPLSLDGTQPPLGFRQIQMIDMSGWKGRSDAPQLEAVRRGIAAAIGQAVPARAPRKTRQAGISRRTALAGGGRDGRWSRRAVGLIAWETGLIGAGTAGPEHRRAAVQNLSGDPAQAYLSEGLTEEVRSALSRNAGLMVLAAASSNTVGDERVDAVSIARKLGVAYLLEGSVQRAGDVVRVATDLTNGATGFSQWSQPSITR